jgi:YbbR domain-containing protein
MRGFLRWIWSLLEYQFPLKILSVLIAVALWVVVFGSRTIEITKEVPFEVMMGEDQILTEPLPDKITFRLSGPKAFLRSITNRIEDPIRANIRDLKTGVFTHRVYSDSIKLPLGVKVQSINPNVIQIKVEELKRKMVAVRLVTTGEPMSGHKVVRSEVLPPQIRVKGPRNRVLSLTQLPSLPIDLTNLSATTIIPLAFDFKALGIEPDSTLPEVNLEVQARGLAFRVKHVPVMVRATGGRAVKADDEEVTVIVRTDAADGVKVEGDQVRAEIDVRDMPEGEFLKWIRVSLPEKVHLVRVIPPLTRVIVKGP